MDLLKNARIKVLLNYTTGATTKASQLFDCSGVEDVTFLQAINFTAATPSLTIQGSQTTTLTDFTNLSYNSTAVTVSTTVVGGILAIQVNHNIYRYLRTVTAEASTAGAGMVIAIGTGVKNVPTTYVSTEILGAMFTASPST